MISQNRDNHLSSQEKSKALKQEQKRQIRKQIQQLKNRLDGLEKNPAEANAVQKGNPLKTHYQFPAEVTKANLHREVFKIGKDPNKISKENLACPCCQEKECQDTYSMFCPACSFIPEQYQKIKKNHQENDKTDGEENNDRRNNNIKAKFARMHLYFTLLKGLIIYLALRFFLYDLKSLILSLSGSYCSNSFKRHTGICSYTLSIYNLKGQATEGLFLDQTNAIFTLISIVYFIVLKFIIDKNKRQLEKQIKEEDQYSLFVCNVPNYIITSKQIQVKDQKERENKITIGISSKDCTDEIKRLFCEKINQKVKKYKPASGEQEEKNRNMIQQCQYLLENINQRLFYKIEQELEKEIKKSQRSQVKQDSLLNKMEMDIIPAITFCYDVAEISRINQLRNRIPQKYQQNIARQVNKQKQKRKLQSFMAQFEKSITQSKFEQFQPRIQEEVQSLNKIEIQLQKKFGQHTQQRFHTAHFSGNLIVSFQYKFFKDLILQAYEKDAQAFEINEAPLKIYEAVKPGDINWENISQSSQNKNKYNLHSWIVMVMILILSFAAFTDLKLIEKSMEVTTQETPWQVFKRYTFTLFSAGVATLINKGLGNAIQILVNMEKHTRKYTRQHSFIIKNVLAQSINSLFIYIIIYIINPSNPLGPYGLAEKAISLAVVSNLSTLFFQVVRPQSLWQDMKKLKFWQKEEIEKVNKFQIQLNKEYQYPKFDQQGMYISYTLMIFLVSFYGFLVPVITPMVFGFFIALYWVDKYNAFKRSSLDSFDDSRGDIILAIIQLSVVLSAISYFVWDWSIQKEPKFKLLNLMSIFLAIQFTGYQAFIDIQIKNRIAQNIKSQESKKQDRPNLSYQEIYEEFPKTYKSQNLSTKHCKKQVYDYKDKQRSVKPVSHQNKQKFFKLITGPSKIQGQKFRKQEKQNASQACLECNKQTKLGKVYNVLCGHQVCVFCFWNNIYYKAQNLSLINCMLCPQMIDPTLYMPKLQQRLRRKVQLINTKLKVENLNKAENLHLCSESQEICVENGKCGHQYCKICNFQKHENVNCENAFKQRTSWFECPECSLMIQPTNKCYNHFGTQLPQTKCPVCVLGWSDANNHKCKNQKAKPNCWFVNILQGILDIFNLILTVTGFLVLFLVAYSIFQALSLVFLFIVLPVGIIIAVCNCQWAIFFQLTLFFPITLIQGILRSMDLFKQLFLTIPCIRSVISSIKQLPFSIKNSFYEYQPYKQAVFHYNPIKLHSKRRRIGYSLVMLLLLPLLFGLAAGFFMISAFIVLCFTLIMLPYLISGETKTSIWIPIIFYPVMLLYYFAPLYSKFIWNQLKDLLYFYVNYIITMGRYMFCNCTRNDHQEGTSLYGKDQDESFC